jgi:hypothetical protein
MIAGELGRLKRVRTTASVMDLILDGSKPAVDEISFVE